MQETVYKYVCNVCVFACVLHVCACVCACVCMCVHVPCVAQAHGVVSSVYIQALRV